MTRADTASLLRKVGKLDRGSRIPLWRQLRDRLASSIATAHLPPDAPLPSEHDLCAMFAVSRPVVRAALGSLTADAVVVRAMRRGAFVAHRTSELDFAASNIGLFGELTAKGLQVTTRLISLTPRAATKREAIMLRLPPDAGVVHVERVFLIDGQPVSVGVVTLPASKVPGLEAVDITGRSLYTLLRDRYGLTVAKSERWLRAAMPTRQQAALLRLRQPEAVIEIESLGLLRDGTPLEYYTSQFATQDRRLHFVVGLTDGATA